MKIPSYFIVVFLVIHCCAFAQQATMKVAYGSKSAIVDQIMDFEDITVMNVKFKGSAIKGKYYQVVAREYKDGKFVKSSMLFDGTEVEIFQIEDDSMDFNFFTKFEKHSLKVQVRTDRFASKKTSFPLYDNKYNYVLKDFIPGAMPIEVSIAEPVYILGVITPSVHKDGSSSYCEVAYSKVNPELFGKQYNIPHYFLVQVLFKNEVSH